MEENTAPPAQPLVQGPFQHDIEFDQAKPAFPTTTFKSVTGTELNYSPLPTTRSKVATLGQGDLKPALRVLGGHAPVSKPIKADFDEEDGLIIRMKLDGHSDREVVEKLKEEGFSIYHDRTIGSRWSRLRKILEEEDDKTLDDNLSDWHAGEDDELVKAYEAVDEKMSEEIQKIKDRRWPKVANVLASRLRQKKYSGNACSERFEGLQNGTALKAIEFDSDQEGRRKLREDRINAAKTARAAEKARIEADRIADVIKANTRKQIQRDKKRAKQAALKKKADEKVQKVQQREDRRLQQQARREAKVATLKTMKAQRDWTLERYRKEKEIYKRLTGKDLLTELKEAREEREALRQGQVKLEYGSDNDFDLPAGTEAWVHDYDIDAGAPQAAFDSDNNDDIFNEATPIPSSSHPFILPSSNSSSIIINKRGVAPPFSTPSRYPSSIHPLSSSTPRVRFRSSVTKETLLNPRTVMTDSELDTLLHHRGLPARTRNEPHAEVVARLNSADWELVVPDIKELLRDLGEKTEGRKIEMIRRLQEGDAARSFQGSMGVRPNDLDFMRGYEPYKGEFREVLEGYERGNDGGGEMVEEEGPGGVSGVNDRDGEMREEVMEEEIRVAVPEGRLGGSVPPPPPHKALGGEGGMEGVERVSA